MGFNDFIKNIDNNDDPETRQVLVDEFVGQVRSQGYPVFESNTKAVLLYQGNAEKAAIIGDIGNWMEGLYLTQIDGTDLFYLELDLEPDARLEYLLKIDDNEQLITDPLNQYIVHNGFGPNSELAMPGYRRLKCFTDYESGKKGDLNRLQHFNLGPGILPYSHEILVYLPPDYSTDDKPYPVMYVQDGKDYVEFALTPVLLDDLIGSQKIKPLIAVFINPPNRHQPQIPNRMTEYGMNDDYVNFMADELVPFIDQRFHTDVHPESRLVVGDSFGGLISAYVPFLRSDIFGMGYSQSGYQSFNNDSLINAYRTSRNKPIRLYVDVGTYEEVVGAGMLPAGETDFLSANRRFKKVLEKKQYEFVYREYHEGHTWGNWRRHMADALIHFFGTQMA